MHIYIDEVGRGPLAGPVTVGLLAKATGFGKNKKRQAYRSDLQDSKQLSGNKRNRLYQHIMNDSSVIAVTSSKTAGYIDRHGIMAALRKAILQGLRKLVSTIKDDTVSGPYRLHKLQQRSKELGTELVIDGNHDFGLSKKLGIPISTIVKGDVLIKEISAASIFAKVERDRYMTKQAQRFPLYGFEHHKGYGTAYHRAMIAKYGLCKLHRKSYCHSAIGC